MRICSPQLRLSPEATLGGEVYDREVLKHLALLGVHVDLILPSKAPCWTNVPHWRVHRTRLSKGFRWYVSNLVFPPYIKQVYDQQPFDLLRVHSLRFTGLAALAARRLYHLPVPIVAHHHHLDHHWLNPVIEKQVIEGCDMVITVSEFSRRQLADELNVDTSHVEVAYNGVSHTLKPQSRDRALAEEVGAGNYKTLLFMGSLKPRKNLPFLLGVFRHVKNVLGNEVRLIIAGTGSEESRLRHMVKELGIAREVIFAGRVPEANKAKLYSLADVYVHPSRLEGFGLTPAEAMSCGKPVVATAVGSLPEVIVDGETGFLVPLGDQQQFAERVVKLLREEPLARQFGEAGRRRVESLFRWEMVARRLKEIYQQVLNDG